MQTTLPKGWKMVKLDEIVNVDKGKKMATIMSHSKDCQPYIGIDNLRTTQYTNFTKEKDGLSCIETDLLIAWDGANAGTIGYGLKGYVGSTIARLRPSESTTTYYLGHFLKSKFQQFNIQTHGAAIPHLSKSQLLNTLIPLPPLPTQHKIVEILEEADNLRKLRQQADEKMNDLIPSLFVQMFGDPATNPKGWEVVKLKDLAVSVKNGLFKRPHEFGSGAPLINVVDLFAEYKVDLSRLERVMASSDEIEKYFVEDGNLFFCRSSLKKEGVAKCAVALGLKEPTVFECHTIMVRLSREAIKPLFASIYLNHPGVRTHTVNTSQTATMTTVSQNDVLRQKIFLPPLALQQEFSKLVEDIEAEKARQAESRKKLDELFDSLMHRAFTGELAA